MSSIHPRTTSIEHGVWCEAPDAPPPILWVREFAIHLRALGSTGQFDMLLDLGERFQPIYESLDPTSVADAVWAKWPIDARRQESADASRDVVTDG